ncbi:hypothetical protein Ocin01_08586 [Orchesella cincta]|uniref:Uncharacterized protein n=1 Tax=Orchesella cincta TaxID=48709 RepID=A0A1D2MZ59_ORCCI|nr:hypothetical protein Ocin01_08586 [Orchesella cincta]
MAIKREYSILPQGDHDDFHHHVRPTDQRTNRYFCFFTLITLVIFLILAGVGTLTATMFYSDEITTTFGQFWYESEPLTTGSHVTSSADSSSSSWTSGAKNNGTDHSQPEKTTALPSPHSSHTHNHNSTDYKNKTSQEHHHHHQQQLHHGTSHAHNSSIGNHSLGESESYFPRGNNTDSSENGDQSGEDSSEVDSSHSTNMEGEDEGTLNLEDFKERFAETMRTIEKRMENFTGIRRAEFVVPIFMLICFLSFFSLISLCCCMMMRRRDNRRRKLFGKLITDLQTGDTKTVLLNHSDLDD